MSKVDYKQKYKELRSKYMNAVDVSYRLGYEQGQKDAEMEMMQMQLQEAQAAAQAAEAAAMGGEEMVDENGMPIPPEEGGEEMPPEVPQEGGEAAGDELGQSMDELESYVKHEEDLVTQMGRIHGMSKEVEKPEVNTSINMEKREQLDDIFKKWDEEKKKEKKEDK